MTEPFRFPPEFLWGAATSAYQIEGSPLADGAGPSNWHLFSHTPGRTFAGHTADVAADHYRRWERDVELMSELGLGAYRLSLSWSRILPAGRGAPNPRGIGFYDRLVDRLLERGIQPLITLFHWDLPAVLEERGGWLHPDIPDWFADYARTAVEALGDRVRMWATLNEPWVVTDAGHLHGVHPPGLRDPAAAARAAHQLLCAHGAAVRAGRAAGAERIGLVVNLEPKEPASDAAADREAATRADAWMNRQFLDPVLLGCTPRELPEMFGAAWPATDDADRERIREPIDFVGVNYYTRGVMRDAPEAPPVRALHARVPGAPITAVGWEVHATSFARALRWVRDRYGAVPILVTENGAAYHDPPHAPATGIEDPLRIHYLRAHLRALAGAMADGVDVRGYFAWSLLDNFEWAQGYSKRFGLVHVDYGTQQRTVKASGRFYREVIRTRGGVLA